MACIPLHGMSIIKIVIIASENYSDYNYKHVYTVFKTLVYLTFISHFHMQNTLATET